MQWVWKKMRHVQKWHRMYSTGRMGWMAHRKWKKNKQQPSMLPGSAVPGSCLASFHFLWAIHPICPVLRWKVKTRLREHVSWLPLAAGASSHKPRLHLLAEYCMYVIRCWCCLLHIWTGTMTVRPGDIRSTRLSEKMTLKAWFCVGAISLTKLSKNLPYSWDDPITGTYWNGMFNFWGQTTFCGNFAIPRRRRLSPTIAPVALLMPFSLSDVCVRWEGGREGGRKGPSLLGRREK